MKTKTKAALFLLLTLACLYGIRLSYLEVQNGDFWFWGITATPPRMWPMSLGALGLYVLPCSAGWTFVQTLRWLKERRS